MVGEVGHFGHPRALVFGDGAACLISAHAWRHVKEREKGSSVRKSSVSCCYQHRRRYMIIQIALQPAGSSDFRSVPCGHQTNNRFFLANKPG